MASDYIQMVAGAAINCSFLCIYHACTNLICLIYVARYGRNWTCIICTCGQCSSKHPALCISHWLLRIQELSQDGRRATPSRWVSPIRVILIFVRPQAVEDAPIVILLINHLRHRPGNGSWITSPIRVEDGRHVHEIEHCIQCLRIKLRPCERNEVWLMSNS